MSKGFTILELMVSIAIIGILASIVLPRAKDAIYRAIEAKTKNNLSVVRQAISAYTAEHDGPPTDDLQSLITGGYLKEIPMLQEPPYHPEGNGVTTGALSTAVFDASTNAYIYDNIPTDSGYGSIAANCTHHDLLGNSWTTY